MLILIASSKSFVVSSSIEKAFAWGFIVSGGRSFSWTSKSEKPIGIPAPAITGSISSGVSPQNLRNLRIASSGLSSGYRERISSFNFLCFLCVCNSGKALKSLCWLALLNFAPENKALTSCKNCLSSSSCRHWISYWVISSAVFKRYLSFLQYIFSGWLCKYL